MTLHAGTLLGPCEMLSRLGARGMGEGHEDKNMRLDRHAVVNPLGHRAEGWGESRPMSEVVRRLLTWG